MALTEPPVYSLRICPTRCLLPSSYHDTVHGAAILIVSPLDCGNSSKRLASQPLVSTQYCSSIKCLSSCARSCVIRCGESKCNGCLLSSPDGWGQQSVVFMWLFMLLLTLVFMLVLLLAVQVEGVQRLAADKALVYHLLNRLKV